MPVPEPIDAIQPAVLTGGRAQRFGRDKLLEPLANSTDVLIDRPIAALRAVFGPRIASVGACDASVAAKFDSVIPDPHAGAGPLGGLVAALESAKGPVFILAGDLPRIDAATVRAILAAAGKSPEAWAVLASGKEATFEPCIGLYRPAAVPALRAALDSGRRALHAAIPPDRRVLVPIDPAKLANVNTPVDLLAKPSE